jgi:hypothetical protein
VATTAAGVWNSGAGGRVGTSSLALGLGGDGGQLLDGGGQLRVLERLDSVRLGGERSQQVPVAAHVVTAGLRLANLQVGISGESQDLTDYARWAQEATTDGCDAAAEQFAEVRRDEAGHLVRYAAAVQALVDPETGATVPAPPTVTPVAVRPGPATRSARTVRNLQAAMAGEACGR